MAVVASNVVPLAEIKPTRQWDAWTREEEENFFGALRQVGKNFEKITSRVQSKNKDQVLWTPLPVRQPDQHKAPAWVRHYYYRVIKRMNRILAPTLILDAKNSTYVNSAMLRWWSLLEKHSCSASKLRLKPRRFKTFVTALENQLLKDHKKVKTKKPTPAAATSRRHAAHSEAAAMCSTGLPGLVSSGSEDLQTLPTVGAGRRAAVKRKAASNGPRKALPKGEAKRPPRPRKKATDGNASKGAFAKWEKAASVGVSLVAEAAEQLERASEAEVMPLASAASELQIVTATGGLINLDLQTGQIPPSTSAAFAELGLSDKIAKELPTGPPVPILGLGCVPVSSSGLSGVVSPSPLAYMSAAMSVPAAAAAPNGVLPNVYEGGPGGLVIIPELCAQVKAKSLALDSTRCNNCSSLRCGVPEEAMTGAKLKLQLFPFSDCIRKALEQDGHNPHLELTFRPKKSISSVLNHLVQKWGRSAVASGDLRLFPFSTQWSDLSACQSWSFQDLNVSAADVLAALGNPPVFRLRYAWLSSRVLESSPAVLQQQPQGPALYESGLVPVPGRESIAKEKSPPLASTSRGVCVGSSTVMSTEVRGPAEQVPQLAVKERRNGLAKQVLPPFRAGWNVQVGVPPEGSGGHLSFFLPGMEFEHPVVSKLPCANRSRTPDVTLGSRSDKEMVPRVLDPVPSADKGAGSGSVDPSKCKELESANQISGCAWLDESNDGFAQDIWTNEDTLRSTGGLSYAQMEWADSFTNMSMSELFDESARAVVPSAQVDGGGPVPSAPVDGGDPVPSAPVDGGGPVPSAPVDGGGPPQASWFAQLNSLDSFDIAIAGQELALPPSVHHSEALFGGEDTCDAFSFQRVDLGNAEVVISMSDELCRNSLDAAIMADFRSKGREREGDLLSAAFDIGQQLPHCQSQDLMFDGEASIGLGGLIEALAQRSQDEFTAFDKEMAQGGGFSGQASEWNGELRKDPPRTDGIGIGITASFRELARIEELSNGSSELIGLLERMPEASLPSINPAQDREFLKGSRPVNGRLARKKERRQAQSPFKLPGQYSPARSLKLQG